MRDTYLVFMLVCVLACLGDLFAQDVSFYDEFVDPRDGTVYQTLRIHETLWIAENMKFKTANSEQHFVGLSDTAYSGYYYPMHEVDQVCPDGFRIAKSSDWESYVRFIMNATSDLSSEVEVVRMRKRGEELVTASMSYPADSMNVLNLVYDGFTENGEVTALGSFNIWIRHDGSDDPKYHLHMDDDGFSVHTHKHHIIDKEKKRRKFSVRCVAIGG